MSNGDFQGAEKYFIVHLLSLAAFRIRDAKLAAAGNYAPLAEFSRPVSTERVTRYIVAT